MNKYEKLIHLFAYGWDIADDKMEDPAEQQRALALADKLIQSYRTACKRRVTRKP